MTLQQCTKEELLQILERVTKVKPCAWCVEQVLSDIQFAREQRLLDKADALNQRIKEISEELSTIRKSYDGKLHGELPRDVLTRMQALMYERNTAQAEWMRVMGLTKSKRRNK